MAIPYLLTIQTHFSHGICKQQSATHSISQGYNNQINNQPVDGYAWSKQNTHGVISHICYAVFKSGNGKSAYQKYPITILPMSSFILIPHKTAKHTKKLQRMALKNNSLYEIYTLLGKKLSKYFSIPEAPAQ